MATYDELYAFFADNSTLRKRVEVAVAVAAEIIRSGNDDGTGDGSGFIPEGTKAGAHAARLAWAKTAFDDTAAIGLKVLKATLAANRSATVSQITNATNGALQTNVNAAVDLLAGVLEL